MKQKCEYCHKKVKHTKLIEHDRVFTMFVKTATKTLSDTTRERNSTNN